MKTAAAILIALAAILAYASFLEVENARRTRECATVSDAELEGLARRRIAGSLKHSPHLYPPNARLSDAPAKRTDGLSGRSFEFKLIADRPQTVGVSFTDACDLILHSAKDAS